MTIQDFNNTIDIWIGALERYDFEQLRRKPSADSWSVGQMYMHLIENTDYYIEQIKICVATDEHAAGEVAPHGKAMLLNNDFPDEIIEGPASNLDTPQPESKEHLMRRFIKLKEEMNDVAHSISASACRGKTQHPGLNYLSANEWLQFAEMHLRHHLRQKKRIDDFLKSGVKKHSS